MNRDIETKPTCPWHGGKLLTQPLSTCAEDREKHVSRWIILFNFEDKVGKLFGCTEDITRGSNPDVHVKDWEIEPFCRRLCPLCEIPVCRECALKLRDHNAESPACDGGTIPMSISNDHYYRHVSRYIVDNNVTWLECAACCTVWSTMLVYYLETPFGNLINVPFGQPEGRAQVKRQSIQLHHALGGHGKVLLGSGIECKKSSS